MRVPCECHASAEVSGWQTGEKELSGDEGAEAGDGAAEGGADGDALVLGEHVEGGGGALGEVAVVREALEDRDEDLARLAADGGVGVGVERGEDGEDGELRALGADVRHDAAVERGSDRADAHGRARRELREHAQQQRLVRAVRGLREQVCRVPQRAHVRHRPRAPVLRHVRHDVKHALPDLRVGLRARRRREPHDEQPRARRRRRGQRGEALPQHGREHGRLEARAELAREQPHERRRAVERAPVARGRALGHAEQRRQQLPRRPRHRPPRCHAPVAVVIVTVCRALQQALERVRTHKVAQERDVRLLFLARDPYRGPTRAAAAGTRVRCGGSGSGSTCDAGWGLGTRERREEALAEARDARVEALEEALGGRGALVERGAVEATVVAAVVAVAVGVVSSRRGRELGEEGGGLGGELGAERGELVGGVGKVDERGEERAERGLDDDLGAVVEEAAELLLERHEQRGVVAAKERHEARERAHGGAAHEVVAVVDHLHAHVAQRLCARVRGHERRDRAAHGRDEDAPLLVLARAVEHERRHELRARARRAHQLREHRDRLHEQRALLLVGLLQQRQQQLQQRRPRLRVLVPQHRLQQQRHHLVPLAHDHAAHHVRQALRHQLHHPRLAAQVPQPAHRVRHAALRTRAARHDRCRVRRTSLGTQRRLPPAVSTPFLLLLSLLLVLSFLLLLGGRRC